MNKPNFWLRELIDAVKMAEFRDSLIEGMAWKNVDQGYVGFVGDTMKPTVTTPASTLVTVTPGRVYFKNGSHATLINSLNVDLSPYIPVGVGNYRWVTLIARYQENGYTPVINYLGDQVMSTLKDEMTVEIISGELLDSNNPVLPTDPAYTDGLILCDILLWHDMLEITSINYDRRVIPGKLDDMLARIIGSEAAIEQRSLITHQHAGEDIISGLVGLDRVGGVYYDRISGKPTYFPANWLDITDKPDTFTPSPHIHTISDITGLQQALSDIIAAIGAATPPSIPELLWRQTEVVTKNLATGLYLNNMPEWGADFTGTGDTGSLNLKGFLVTGRKYGIRLEGDAVAGASYSYEVYLGKDQGYATRNMPQEPLMAYVYISNDAGVTWTLAGYAAINRTGVWAAVSGGYYTRRGSWFTELYFTMMSQGILFDPGSLAPSTIGGPTTLGGIIPVNLEVDTLVKYRIRAGGPTKSVWSDHYWGQDQAVVTLNKATIYS